MGTDVNPVAWENAEIMAYALMRNPKSQNLADFYLEFTSYLTEKHGQAKVRSGSGLVFLLGDREYRLDVEQTPFIPALTRILYEVFYKHQF